VKGGIVERSGTVRTNGQELYFEIHGRGTPLVLIMGIGYDSSLWKLHQVPALSEKFEVIIFDNRDVGRSSKAAGAYTIADMADDLAGLLDALGIARAHVLGLSLGSMIAQEFALRHSGHVDRLVLMAPDAAPARDLFHPVHAWSWVKEHDPSGGIFACEQFSWLFSSAFRRNTAAVEQTIAFLAANPKPVSADAYARQANAYLSYDPGQRLRGIRSPTLVIVGEQDLLTPPWIAAEVAGAIPGARLEIVRGDGASHVLPLERPGEFHELVNDFFRENAATNGVSAGSAAAAAAAAPEPSPAA
jgi:3-oxoadipate enol-lactonase